MIARRSVLALSLLALGRLASAGSYEDFFVAIQRDDGVTVESLLRRGFDPNTSDAKGQPGPVSYTHLTLPTKRIV